MSNRFEIMANNVRRNASHSTARYSNYDLIKLFNDAQNVIRSIIHTADGTGRFYPKTVEMDLVSGKAFYDLPDDCYAFNSINEVSIQTDNSIFQQSGQLKQITAAEKSVSNGYYPYGRQIRLSYEPYTGGKLRINYSVKIPTLSPRFLEVQSYNEGRVKAKRESFDTGIDILNYGDMASIVDKRGKILHCNLEIKSHMSESGTVTFEGDYPSGEGMTIEPGNFLVVGGMASTHTRLPEEVLHLLTSMVQRMMKGIDASVDFSKFDYLTESEKKYVEELFGDSGNDGRSTPLGSDNYLAW